MKKTMLAAVLAVFLCASVAWSKALNVACPTNSTTCSLVSNSATKGISIAQILFSLSTADNLTVNCGSTTMLGPIYFGTSSGLSQSLKLEGRNYAMLCRPGSDLTVTKGTSTTPVTIWLDYDQ